MHAYLPRLNGPKLALVLAFTTVLYATAVAGEATTGTTASSAPAKAASQSNGDVAQSVERIAKALEATVAQKEADKSDDRPARDLGAQEEMAKWARFSFLVTLIGAIVSGLGLFALLCSLRLNRRATEAAQTAVTVARETNESQSRAWLSANCMLEGPEEGTTHLGVDGIWFNVACQAKNHGRSPATAVSFHAEIALVGKDTPDPKSMMEKYCDSIRERADRDAEAIFPDSTALMGHTVFLAKKDIAADMATKDFKMISPVVYGCLNYKTLYTKGVRQTRFVYHVSTINAQGQIMVLQPESQNWLSQRIALTAPGTVTTD